MVSLSLFPEHLIVFFILLGNGYTCFALSARLFSASSALICNNEISFSAAAKESCNSDIRSSLSSLSAQRVSVSTSMSSSLAVTSSGLSSGVSDAGLPSEKVVASG
ncbi:hypothetical protein Tco_1348599 [Tanacetum coccineum]